MRGVVGDGSPATDTTTSSSGEAAPLTIVQITQLLTFGIGGVELLFLVSLVHTIWRDHGISYSLLRQPRTLLLIGIISGATGYHLCSASDGRQVNALADVNILVIVSGYSASFFEISYMWYQWYRSYAIIRAVLNAFAVRVFVGVIQITTILCLIQPLVFTFSIFWHKVFIVITVIGIGVMDVFFCIVSLQVLRNETQTMSILSSPESSKSIQYYQTVAKYSVQASVSMFFVFACYVIQAYFQMVHPEAASDPDLAYYGAEIGIHAFILMTVYCLTWMKYSLDSISKERAKKRKKSKTTTSTSVLKSASVESAKSSVKSQSSQPPAPSSTPKIERRQSRAVLSSIDLVRPVLVSDHAISHSSTSNVVRPKESNHSRRPSSELALRVPAMPQDQSRRPSKEISSSTRSTDALRRTSSDQSVR
ncbi:hypothetical protein BDR26DRAFT_856831, partial [Obelidium mucronatum]